MTLHISYDHDCPECGASYIPYGKDVPCPKCGMLEQERFADFTSQAAESALYNVRSGGSYMPMAWGCFSLADSILMFLFQMFDGYRVHGEGESFETFAKAFVKDSVFGDSEHLREYTGRLAIEVHQMIEKQQAV